MLRDAESRRWYVTCQATPEPGALHFPALAWEPATAGTAAQLSPHSLGLYAGVCSRTVSNMAVHFYKMPQQAVVGTKYVSMRVS